MVKQLSDFLARMVRTHPAAPGGPAHPELEGLARSFVGLGLDALEALPADRLAAMLSLGGSLDVNRAYAAGRLLEDRAEAAWAGGDTAAAHAAATKALHLFAKSALAFGSYLNEEHATALDRVVHRVLVRDAQVLRGDPSLLCDVLAAQLQAGEGGALRRLAAALQATEPVADDAITALRVALRGRCAMLLGRLEPIVRDDRNGPDRRPGPPSDRSPG